MSKYTAKFFRESMPDWKKKKDPLIAQLLYRPLSFYISSFCANRGMSANSVSYFSMAIAFLACVCYLYNNHSVHVVGAVLVNIWLLLDCVDGNIARSVRKQPFGKFADATSSLFLISFLYFSMSIAIYEEGGEFVNKGNILIVAIATFGTTSDSFMRLLYHQYKIGQEELFRSGVDQNEDAMDLQSSEGNLPNMKERILEALGIGGYLPLFILICTYFHMADLIIYYICIINVVKCSAVSLKCIRNAIKLTAKYEKL